MATQEEILTSITGVVHDMMEQANNPKTARLSSKTLANESDYSPSQIGGVLGKKKGTVYNQLEIADSPLSGVWKFTVIEENQ